MVNLLAMIFLMVNGAPTKEPVRSFTYNQTFESVEACMAFSQTEEGIILKYHVNEYVISQKGTIVARLGCAVAEDNTI
jgi:hypothetical protein